MTDRVTRPRGLCTSAPRRASRRPVAGLLALTASGLGYIGWALEPAGPTLTAAIDP